ncbi:hypothetical protein V8E54_012898 [Elaphomyces granulatus]
MDANAMPSFSDYITDIDRVDHMWFKNFSDNSYTLCYIRSEQVQPMEASLWLVGHVPYGVWMLSIHLPPTDINALATHLEPGPFKSGHFDSTWNIDSVINVKATLESVEEEFEGDIKGIMPMDQPYPFIYDASMGTEISECEKLPMVGLLLSISGHELEIDESEPGYYSFNMRAMYYLGGAPLWTTEIGREDQLNIDL